MAVVVLSASTLAADTQVLDGAMHHIRCGTTPEWAEFPEHAEADRLEVEFQSESVATACTLRLRQQDVKQNWKVMLNGQQLGKLPQDENDMVVYFPVRADQVRSGKNLVAIIPDGESQSVSDDIRVGELSWIDTPREEIVNAARVRIHVIDDATGTSLPARITILNEDGALQPIGAESSRRMAVRTGTVYGAPGKVEFGLPAGRFEIIAGRGIEYSIAREVIEIAAGETVERELRIKRETPLAGYVACDTHIHTLTHSGHGDATIEERLLTLAGEGIELAIATDHNKHIDYAPLVAEMGLQRFFTSVIGNEVTTSVGHFNVFPIAADAPIPNHRLSTWPEIFDDIRQKTSAPVVILNHARDLHSGVRPFGPDRYHSLVAEPRNDWPIGFNAMEVINSSATQSEPMQLLHDWMRLLNRGHQVTPIGSSDSHDVLRHFVGQGRTYIRCDDRDPGAIDVGTAVDRLVAGHVLVSYGLAVIASVDGKSSGDLVPVTDSAVDVHLQVIGPSWVDAERVELFVNGELARRIDLSQQPSDREFPAGVLWEGVESVTLLGHDVHFVAIVRGPGLQQGYWRAAKPYQPTSIAWKPEFFGCSGALLVDADGDGSFSSARALARQVLARVDNDPAHAMELLEQFHPSVVYHVLHLLEAQGIDCEREPLRGAIESRSAGLRHAVETYVRAVKRGDL
jgi:hypothetical protein